MRAIMLLVVLASCGPALERAPDCVTPCGMNVYGTGACDGLEVVELRALIAFGPFDSQMCQRLHGWRMSVALTDLHAIGREGQTWCDAHGVQIMTDDWAHSAYAHELAHVQQCPWIDYSHETWTWQWRAIDQANGAPL